MRRSTNHILTTHTGSLPRGPEMLAALQAKERGEAVDQASFDALARQAVAETLRRQLKLGIDVVSDGEQSKVDYSTYIKERLTGFQGESVPIEQGRDVLEFPEYQAMRDNRGAATALRPTCVGLIEWQDFEAVKRDIDYLRAVAPEAEEVFMTAVSPGQAARFLRNRYYKTDEEYLQALGRVLKDEYEAIVAAGFILQLDCPDLGSGWNNQFRDMELPEFLKRVDLHLEVLGEATRNIPAESMRLHLCWGNYTGPHNHDIPLREIIGPVLRARPAGISFEGANPRHEHEWDVFADVKLPDDKVLIPGVIDSTTNFIEHPELVAQRIVRYAGVVGRERVIAGTDCGFATFAATPTVLPSITWAKLEAMVQGARIATSRLW